MPLPRHRLAEAARALKPLRQGQLDELCGVYAVLNATRLALYPRRLSTAQLKQLFASAIRTLSQKRQLRTALTNGMYVDQVDTLLSQVAAETAKLHPGKLNVARLVHCDPHAEPSYVASKWIRRCVRQGQPVLIALYGMHDHLTVVARFTSTRLILFDSFELAWVDERSLHPTPTGDQPLHNLEPSEFRALSFMLDDP